MKVISSPKEMPWVGARGKCTTCFTEIVLEQNDTVQGVTGPLGEPSWTTWCPCCRKTYILCSRPSTWYKQREPRPE